MFKKILIGLVVVIVVFAVIVAMQPSTFHIERSVAISAPPAAVFPQVNEARRWEAWSPYAKRDPHMTLTYEGPSAGVGAVYAWSGNREVGEGRSTIVESRPYDLVKFKLEFFKPMKGVNDVTFTFRPEGNQTVVTWSMDGKNNFVARAVCVFMDMDKMVGGDFEKGLTQLKALVEGSALAISRMFEAPREKVWKAWTDPALVKRWWGPKNYTSPLCKIDLRVGGSYLFGMRSPEGKDYWSAGVYQEIAPPERLVFTDAFADKTGKYVPASEYGMAGDWPMELLITLDFQEREGKTEMALRHFGIPEGEMKEMTKAGWNQSFDKFAAVLKQIR